MRKLIESDLASFPSPIIRAMSSLDISKFSEQDIELLVIETDESRAGICDGLQFLGDTLTTFANNNVVEFTAESLHQLGRWLSATSTLLPMLIDLQQQADAESQRRSAQAGIN